MVMKGHKEGLWGQGSQEGATGGQRQGYEDQGSRGMWSSLGQGSQGGAGHRAGVWVAPGGGGGEAHVGSQGAGGGPGGLKGRGAAPPEGPPSQLTPRSSPSTPSRNRPPSAALSSASPSSRYGPVMGRGGGVGRDRGGSGDSAPIPTLSATPPRTPGTKPAPSSTFTATMSLAPSTTSTPWRVSVSLLGSVCPPPGLCVPPRRTRRVPGALGTAPGPGLPSLPQRVASTWSSSSLHSSSATPSAYPTPCHTLPRPAALPCHPPPCHPPSSVLTGSASVTNPRRFFC